MVSRQNQVFGIKINEQATFCYQNNHTKINKWQISDNLITEFLNKDGCNCIDKYSRIMEHYRET